MCQIFSVFMSVQGIPARKPARKTARIEYVDRLRGLAVVAMFFVHSAGAWLAPEVKGSGYWVWAMRISGMVAPVFMFLAGISISLIAFRYSSKDRDEREALRRIVVRGAKIVLLGYGMHVVFWLLGGFGGPWWKVLKVDILHAIGFSLIILPVLAWPRRRFNWSAMVLFLTIPVLGQVCFRLPLCQWLPQGIAAYFTTRSRLALFPFLPYSAWVALGMTVGPFWVRAVGDKRAEKRFWILLVIAALAMYAFGKTFRLAYYSFGWHLLGGNDIPTKGLVHLFFVKGAVVLALFFLARVSSGLFDKIRLNTLVLFGRTSLFAYCVHLAIIYHLAGPFCIRSLSPIGQVVGASVLSVVMFGACVLWIRVKYRVVNRG